MKSILLLILMNFKISSSFNLYDVDETSPRIPDDIEETNRGYATLENVEFEPITVSRTIKNKEKMGMSKNLNCEEFSQYAVNCTMQAAMIYNSSRNSPPMPAKMGEWCRSIRHLTNCAIDWNGECQDLTESHFNAESIKGHMHVVENVCDDEWFLSQYDSLPGCIDRAGSAWVTCYSDFKAIVVKQKNGSQEWTHYVTHFHLCCARTRFRRCIFDVLFNSDRKCEQEQAITLQKFSVIVSEGDVYQDCDKNMMYENCPGGDPRPKGEHVAQLMNTDTQVSSHCTTLLQDEARLCAFCVWCAILMAIIYS